MFPKKLFFWWYSFSTVIDNIEVFWCLAKAPYPIINLRKCMGIFMWITIEKVISSPKLGSTGTLFFLSFIKAMRRFATFSSAIFSLSLSFSNWSGLCPAGTATLWQRCDNVVVDVVTALWHGRKWEFCRRHNVTLRRYQDVATTLLQRCNNIKHWIFRAFYNRSFWFLSFHRNVRELPKCLVALNTHRLSLKERCTYS